MRGLAGNKYIFLRYVGKALFFLLFRSFILLNYAVSRLVKQQDLLLQRAVHSAKTGVPYQPAEFQFSVTIRVFMRRQHLR